eukprot:184109_1
MPESIISDFKKGTTARTFSTNNNEMDSSWTDTPNQLNQQKKLQKKIKKIEKNANQKLKLFGLPKIKKKKQNEDDHDDDTNISNKINTNTQMDDHNTNRQKSLFEIHQETLMAEYKKELKEWKKSKKN